MISREKACNMERWLPVAHGMSIQVVLGILSVYLVGLVYADLLNSLHAIITIKCLMIDVKNSTRFAA